MPLLLRAFKPAPRQLGPGTQASVVKGVQACRLPTQRPYTALSNSNGSTLRSSATHCLVEGSRLQTPKRSAATLHTVLLTLQGYLRASQPLTHCLVGAARVPAFRPRPSTLRSGPTQCFAEASTQDPRLPTFKRVHPPQRPYTLYC